MKMRYRGFTFPHNPKRIEVAAANREAVFFLPGAGQLRQHMGGRGRRITGEGSFCGADAAYQSSALAKLQQQGGSGLLHLPSFPPIRAFFTALTIICEGDGQVYNYKFEFTEDTEKKSGEDGYAAMAVYGYPN